MRRGERWEVLFGEVESGGVTIDDGTKHTELIRGRDMIIAPAACAYDNEGDGKGHDKIGGGRDGERIPTTIVAGA